VTAEASLLSCICVVFIFVRIAVRLTSIHVLARFDDMLHSGMYDGIGGRFQTVVGSCFGGLLTFTWSAYTVFLLPFTRLIGFSRQFSLFTFDLLQSIGGILNIRWAHNGIVTTGHYCTAQGLVEQIGELGVALITLVCLLSYYLCM
jgi:hypothetical protein